MALFARYMSYYNRSAGESGSSWSCQNRGPPSNPQSAPHSSLQPPPAPACCPPLTLPQYATLSPPAPVLEVSQPAPPVTLQVQTSQPGLEIGTSIYLSGLVLSDVDEQTLLDYVGSLIRDSMKKCFSAYWEEICEGGNVSVLTA